MTYDYVCTVCAHVWEAEQRITADPLKDCPNCHQMTAKRQISGGQGFILKGGGWYSDLYSSAKPEMAADSAKESKESKGSKESKDSKESKSESKEPKSESKTESKTETKTEKAASPSASGAGGSTARPAASSTE
jgi:putative FmdB family regulatory protein